MEGFLWKKGRGEGKSLISKRNWKRRYFILDGGYLTYYENFDTTKNIPVNKKGVTPIYGSRLLKVNHADREHVFTVEHDIRKPLHLSAETLDSYQLWTHTLLRAANGALGPPVLNLEPYYQALGIEKEQEAQLTTTSLNKIFRKKAVKMHPDTGGDLEEFRVLQEAFEMLSAKLEGDELGNKYHDVHFVAKIVKQGPGVGMGMVVVEDPKTCHVLVKQTLPKIKYESIDEVAGATILVNDRLMAIDDDDVSTWTMARVVQRLGDFRCPVGSTVALKFCRPVLKEGESLPVAAIGEVEAEVLASETPAARSRRMSTMDSVYSGVSTIASSDFEASVAAQAASEEAVTETGTLSAYVNDAQAAAATATALANEMSDKLSVSDLGADPAVSGGGGRSRDGGLEELMTREQIIKSDRALADVAISAKEVSTGTGSIDDLIRSNPRKEAVSPDICASKGVDVRSRNALVVGLATISWASPTVQESFLTNTAMHVNNLALLNETLKGFEMKVKRKMAKEMGAAAQGGGAATSGMGSKKKLHKARVSVVGVGSSSDPTVPT